MGNNRSGKVGRRLLVGLLVMSMLMQYTVGVFAEINPNPVSTSVAEAVENGTSDTSTEALPQEEKAEAVDSKENAADTKASDKKGDAADSKEGDRTVFKYADTEKLVTATVAEAGVLPEGAELVVANLSKSEKAEAEKIVQEEIGDKNELVSVKAYDVHFEVNGQEIEPDSGKVKVKFDFTDGIPGVSEKGDSEVQLIHILDSGEAEKVKVNTEADKNGEVKSADFVVSEFSTFAYAEVVREEYTSAANNYKLAEIMSNYNILALGNDPGDGVVMKNHTMGGIICRGDFSGENSFHDQGTLPSYVEGTWNYNGHCAGRGSRGVTLYVNKDKNRVTNNGLDVNGHNVFYSQANGHAEAIAPGTFIDWDVIKKDIDVEMDKLSAGSTMVIHARDGRYVNGKHIVEIPAGSNVTLDTDGLTDIQLSLSGPGTPLEKLNKDTIITIKGTNVVLPLLDQNQYPHGEDDKGCGLVFVCPEATYLTTGNYDAMIGHILAPNAYVKQVTGDYNGCIVCKSIETVGEGHVRTYKTWNEVITNLVTPSVDRGDFDFNKTFSYVGDSKELTPEQKRNISFEIVGPKEYKGDLNNLPEIKNVTLNNGRGDLRTLGSDKLCAFKMTIPFSETNNGKISLTGLPVGTYTFKEINANVDGYKLDADVPETIVVTKGNKTTENATNTYKQEVPVSFSKKDLGGNELAGATVEIKQGNDVVKSWKSDGSVKKFDLVPGSYTFVETAAPEGYKIATAISFKVNNNGTITVGGKTTSGGSSNIVAMVDDYALRNVKFSKKDLGGDELAGATITVAGTDASGNAVSETWVSNGTAHEIKLPMGSYTMTETAAPEGHTIASAISFTVNANGTITVGNTTTKSEADNIVVMVDGYKDQKVTISKVNLGGTEIAGAAIQIKDTKGNVVANWVSEANKSHDITVQPGTYTFHEESAPNGYVKVTDITFSVDKLGKVTIVSDEDKAAAVKDGKLVITDDLKDRKVKFSKVDIAGDELEGATITVNGTDAAGKTIKEIKWVSDGKKPHELELPMGTYTMTETSAPKGYVVATAITFTVNAGGTVTVNGVTSESEAKNIVTMVDGYADQTVTISKVDAGGTEIAGAKIEVTDKKGNKVAEWTSEADKSHAITVQPGEYTFHEVSAPEGYEAVTDITFKVDKDGKVTVTGTETNAAKVDEKTGKLVITDELTDRKVKFSKVDIAGDELKGATITVTGTDATGKAIEAIEWVSDGKKPHELELPMGTYIMTETATPEGYVTATSIRFTVNANGSITVGETTSNSEAENIVTMVDGYADQKVIISKTDINGTKEIAGAELKVTDKNGTEVASWTSEEGKSHEVTLQPGIYTLTETTAPEGYKVAENVTFKVDHTGKVQIITTNDSGEETATDASGNKVVMKDDYSNGKVIIKKTDVAGTEIEGAKLVITDKDNKEVASWISEAGKQKEVELYPGTYTLTETSAPEGYEKAESITFTVDQYNKVTVDGKEVGAVVMVDDYSNRTVKISKVDAGGKEIAGAKIEVTDKEGNKVAEWTSEAGKSHDISVKPGEYTFKEVNAPDGYEAVTEIKFSVDKEGKVTVTDTASNAAKVDEKTGKLVITDELTDRKVKFSKTDLAGDELEGATITVTGTNAAGQTIDAIEWVSDGKKPHELELPMGTYTMTETAAPGGYEIATAIEFTVNANGTVTVNGVTSESEAKNIVTMVDGYADQTVTISKVDAGGKEIAGAEIKVTQKNEDGEEVLVEKWTSEANKSHNITVQPGEYTFHEVNAPNGYEAVTDITFKVDKDGKVTVTGAASNAAKVDEETGKLVITDELKDRKVKFSKTDIAGDELEGAIITVNGTDAAGQAIKEIKWESTGHAHELELPMGTYTMTETAAPKGYVIATEIEFTVNANGTITVGKTTSKSEAENIVTMVDGYADQTVTISKVDAGGKEIGGAEIKVTQKNKDGEEVLVEKWTSEAGKSHDITVKPGEYTFHEVNAPEGYEAVTEIKFSVDKDGKVTVTSTETNAAKVDEKTGKLVITDELKDRKVKFSKTDIAGKELAGATITVTGTDAAGQAIKEIKWVSDGKKPHELELPMGSYTMTETAAPEGYTIATKIDFTVNANGTVTVNGVTSESEAKNIVTMVDGYADQKVKISKTNINGTKEIAGAELKVTDKNGTEVASWTSEEGKSHEVTLQPGRYTLTETTAPTGYKVAESITFTVDHTGKVQIITNDESGEEKATDAEGNKVVMKDDYSDGKVIIKKTDVAGAEIEGAKLVITDKDNKEVASWISEAGKQKEVELYPGTYTLTETSAPEGYEKAESITFTVDENNVVKVKGETVGAVVMVDDYEDQTVTISKVDAGGKEIAGAEIKVTDKDGNTVDEWTSGDDKDENDKPIPHEITVKPGEYTFHEVNAPNGYEAVTEIKFSVDKDGNVTVTSTETNAAKVEDGKLVITDELTDRKVKFSKTDIAGKELAGATIKVTGTDAAGQKIEETWVSDGTAKELELPMGSYTMTETAAPEGYTIATKIDFTVNANGTVTVNGVTSESEAKNIVTMVDGYADQKVKISKVDAGGKEIGGAEIKVTDKDGNTVDEWTSGDDKDENDKPIPHEITVKPGEYTFHEVNAPEGYEAVTEIKFSVDKDGKVTVTGAASNAAKVDEETGKLVITDELTDRKVKFSKTDIAGKELAGATITVTGTDAAGQKIEETWVSDGTAKELELPMGSYTMTETAAPEGYTIATKIDFTVNANGTVTVNGVTSESEAKNIVTMVDGYDDQTVTISKVDAGGKEIGGAEIKVTDKDGNTVDEWTSEAGKSHDITVKPGEYTFHEVNAPEGYEAVTEIKFSVDKDGNVTVTSTETNAAKVDEKTGKLVITDELTDRKVKFSKTDIAGKELAGATITVTGTDAAGQKIEEKWVSDGKAKELELPMGSYTMTETAAPDGYKIATAIEFTVNADGTITVGKTTTESEDKNIVTMVDGYADQKVKISKTDINGTKEIAGAELKVTDKNGTEVASWTSEEGKSHEVTLQPGRYTLTETSAPKGYKVAESITFTVDHTGKVQIITKDESGEEKATDAEGNKVVMKDDYSDGKVIIKKTDVAGAEIEGAKLVITDKDNKEVASWTSEAGKQKEVELYPGTYTLTETSAPGGYEKAESITFTVDENNVVKVKGETVGAVVMVDDYEDQTVTISKVDAGGKEIAGAEIKVTDKDGNTVDEWTSEAGKSHDITVKPGEYTFKEVNAPEGYEAVTEIKFSVDKDGNVTVTSTETNAAKVDEKTGKLVITDELTDRKVKFSKTDIAGKELAGATITVTGTDAAGQKIEETWVSDGKAKELELPMGSYTMTETAAPEGYTIATAIEFTVNANGTITVGKTTSNSEAENIVTMVDGYISQPEPAKIEVKKSLVIYNEEMEREDVIAESCTFYVALFEDAEFTKMVGSPEKLTFENESVSTATFEDGIEAEKKYYISEVDENGKVITTGNLNGRDYTAEYPDGQEVTAASGKTATVAFKNVFVEMPEHFYKEGRLNVTKKVVDNDGKALETREKFYVGIFEDAKFTKLSDKVDKNIIELNLDGKSSVDVFTNVMLETDETLNLYVAEVDKDGNLVENDKSFGYTVSYSGEGNCVAVSEEQEGSITITNTKPEGPDDVTVTISKVDAGGKEIGGAEIKVTDKDGNTVDEWTSEAGKSHDVSVKPGEYTFKEVNAPDGYEAVTEIKFTVDEDGKVTVTSTETNAAKVDEETGKLVITDELTDRKVKFSKTDIAGKELAGATIKVTGTDAAGQKIEKTWVSDGTAKELELPMGSYTMTETAAPKGYKIATAIEFTVNADGTVTVNGVTSESEAKNIVTMVDGYADQTVTISKVDAGGKEIGGAEIKVTDKGGNTVDEWTSEAGKSHNITVKPGEYTFKEVNAPEGYEAVTEIKFSVDKDGNVTVTSTETNAAKVENGKLVITDELTDHKVKFSKTDIAGKELAGATIIVTGTDAAGQKIEKTWVSDGKNPKELELPMGSYTMTETAAPKGYKIATAIEFTVNADGTITVGEITTKSENENIITMVDNYADQPTPPDEKPKKDKPNPPAKRRVNTGDDSNPAGWLFLMVGSLGAIVLTERKRKSSR